MRYSKEEKALWLEQWRNSGKSAWAYAKENGLCQQTFVKWAKAGKENSGRFVEVALPIQPAAPDGGEMVAEKGGVRIHIPMTCTAACLRTIFTALGGWQ